MAKEKLAQFAKAQMNAASIDLTHLLDSFEAEFQEGGFKQFDTDSLQLLIRYCDSMIQAASRYMSADDDLMVYEETK